MLLTKIKKYVRLRTMKAILWLKDWDTLNLPISWVGFLRLTKNLARLAIWFLIVSTVVFIFLKFTGIRVFTDYQDRFHIMFPAYD